jgi:alpha-mannosidase
VKKNIVVFIILALVTCSFSSVYGQKKSKSKPVADTIHVVGHAHMDMNWLWTYSETMQMSNDNLRQVVAFMDEFPDFTMSQSQAAIFNFVEMVDPPLLEQVKKYVKAGRLELTGGMWTEGDLNLSSGEAIARSFLLGQRYFQSRFGKMASIGWLPDNFGHISQYPQILKLAGCDYFYFTRTKPYVGTFWWTGTDNSTVLAYANNTPNAVVTPALKDELQKIAPDKHRIIHITGVGDHGGGPTRADIDMVHQLAKTPDYPVVKFTTAGDFFKKASKEMDGRPTHKGEMQFIFEGCYTTVTDIKAGNRNSENALYSSEFFNTLRWLSGDQYPAEDFNDLWTTVAFNQFHDILPGSAINEANKEASARYSEVLRKTYELRNNAFRKMADEVKFQTGMGQPVVAYNLQPFGRKTLVEAAVYSHVQPFTAKLTGSGDFYGSKYIKPIDKGQGAVPTVLVRDASGKSYMAQVVWGKTTPPGYTSKVQFIVDDMPACGYKTFYVDMTKPGDANEPIPFTDNTFETDFFKVKFDMTTGGIISLIDKRSGKEYVKAGGQLNKLRIYLEDKKGGMKSWSINKIIKEEDVTNVASVKVVENGPVRACVETVKTWGKSRFLERTYLYRSYPRIDYDLEVRWLETGSDTTDSPMLKAIFPIAIDNPVFNCQVPFDVLERPTDLRKTPLSYKRLIPDLTQNYDPAGQEVPAQKWVDLSDGNTGIALLNNTLYGHSYHNGDLRLTLLRSAGAPDMFPNLGKFNISYALFPHAGDWKTGGVWAEGEDFNIPVYAAEPPSLALAKAHASRPEEESFISVDSRNVSLSGIKQSEDGNEMILRLVEVEGKETTVNVKLPVTISAARRLNIIEFPLTNAAIPIVSGQSVQVKIKPNEIVTLGLLPVK